MSWWSIEQIESTRKDKVSIQRVQNLSYQVVKISKGQEFNDKNWKNIISFWDSKLNNRTFISELESYAK